MTPDAVITGWGFYVPPKVLTNADLEAMVDTTDDWIYERTGIRERHVVEGDEVIEGATGGAGLPGHGVSGGWRREAAPARGGGGPPPPADAPGRGQRLVSHPDGWSRGVQARRAGDGGGDEGGARAGGAAPRGRRPFRAAPGERPHHRGGREATRARPFEDLRRYRSLRKYLGCVDPHRAVRRRGAGSGAARRHARVRRVRRRYDVGRGRRRLVTLSSWRRSFGPTRSGAPR